MAHPPIFGFTGRSGSGKTMLLEAVVARFAARGLRVAAVKRARGGFEIDRPGKDSHRLRAAGAAQTLVASAARWALICETPPAEAPDLPALLSRLSPCDAVLIEGFKDAPHPKIEVWRNPPGPPLLASESIPRNIVAVAHKGALPPDAPDLPRFDLDDADAVAAALLRRLRLEAR